MSFNEVSPEIYKKVKGLILGYKDRPQPELLIPIPNPSTGTDYEQCITSFEVTSLCPLTASQPDYATVTIKYRPLGYTIELKSLKFYLVSFRMVKIFHESLAGVILRDLVEACQPKSMKVIADFNLRGGIHTVIEATYEKPYKKEG